MLELYIHTFCILDPWSLVLMDCWKECGMPKWFNCTAPATLSRRLSRLFRLEQRQHQGSNLSDIQRTVGDNTYSARNELT